MTERNLLTELDETPADIIYKGFFNNPDLAQVADALLLSGVVPDLIMRRKDAETLPPHIRAAAIRALEWRREQLMQPKGVG